MNRKNNLLFIILLITSTISAQQKFEKSFFEKFPYYEDVVNAYYLENAFDYNASRTISFGKKIDGWHVIFKDNFGKEVSERMIWNAKKGQFINLKTKGSDEGGIEYTGIALNVYLRGLEPTFYQQYPVYGYANYQKDVIELLKDETDLSDELLDALARSYSAMATETILPGQFSGNYEKLKYDATFNVNDFETTRLEDYIFYMNQAIATFKKITEQYPNYRTIVGNIQTKYYNEYLTAYLSLRFVGQDKLAQQFLADDLYSKFQLKTAINTLNSCAKDGILFTAGDNDTYPLVYVQDKLNIRQDVAIVNLSLLNIGRYIHYIKERYAIQTTYETTHFIHDKNPAFLIDETTTTTDFGDFLNATNENQTLMRAESGYLKIPSKSIAMSVNKANVIQQYQTDTTNIKVQFTIYLNNNYILKNSFLVLDIINTNDFERPIYFTLGSDIIISDLDLKNKTFIEGLAYRVLPIEQYDYNLLVDNLINVFQYDDSEKIKWINREDIFSLNLYLKSYFESPKIAINKETQKVQDVLNALEKQFPLADCPYQNYNIEFANFYLKQDNSEKGDLFIKKGIKEVQGFFESLEHKKINHYIQNDINWYLYIATELAKTIDDFNRDEFRYFDDLVKSYLDKYQ
jgi:hypothetical protein